jgi:glutamate-5-semialdehyde dehydrogenase
MRAVISLPDPAGKILLRSQLQDGLELQKVTCPFGVLAAIIEARPDAVTQIVALALKSGNALLLKAGHEAADTTQALMNAIRCGLRGTSIPETAVCNVVGRDAVKVLLGLEEYIDLVVPRGGNSLVRYVQDNTRIPVMGHADGVCHIFVDQSGQQEMALKIIRNAKVQAPSTCNAVETILVHEAIAASFLPKLAEMLKAEKVNVRGCERTRAIVEAEPVDEWHTEYGDLTIAIRVIGGVDEAIDHINQYGSKHTDSIISEDQAAVGRFMNEVDSAGVFHNASTRFSDGYQYGFGAEVGISTSKLHARGPVGLDGLVTYKYKLFGSGQVRG